MIEKLLRNILDIPGAEGVCVFDLQGNLLCNRFPSLFIAEIFPDLGRRVALLFDSVDDNFVPTEDFLLRYEGKHILIRRNDQVLLFILADEKVNFLSLRMVTNLAIKHLAGPLLKQLSETPEPEAATPPPPPPPPPKAPEPAPVAPPPPAEPPRVRFYRGKSY